MQETRVWSLIPEDTACLKAPKPVRHNYWACDPEPCKLQLLKPTCPTARALQQEKPPQPEAQALHLESSPHSPQLEKSLHSSEDPAQPEINN